MEHETQHIVSPYAPYANGAHRTEQAGRAVLRLAGELRIHPALKQMGFSGPIGEINQLAKVGSPTVAEPVLITQNGTILAGFERWRLALSGAGPAQEIHCIEYAIEEEGSLAFILCHHRIRPQWNRFVLISLALTLEPVLHKRALDNMQAGGKLKGSAILPKAERIDVRAQIANLAGVGARYVSDVKAILPAAHPRIIEALRSGALSIPQGKDLIKIPKQKQWERFKQQIEDGGIDKVIRTCLRTDDADARPDVGGLLKSLLEQETQDPGSIVLRALRVKGAVVLVLQDVSQRLVLQRLLNSHEIQRPAQADSSSNRTLLEPRPN